jgi:hypothetical protein
MSNITKKKWKQRSTKQRDVHRTQPPTQASHNDRSHTERNELHIGEGIMSQNKKRTSPLKKSRECIVSQKIPYGYSKILK